MNCRKVSALLSAYLDQELTGEEMLAVRAHLDDCALCRAEYQSLSDTKRLLSSLALQAPRGELEQLLLCDAERSSRRWPARLVPEWMRDWVIVAWSGIEDAISGAAAADEAASREERPAGGGLRLRPLAATAILSLAGLCLATAKLSGPHEEAPQAVGPEMLGGYTTFLMISPGRAVAVMPAGTSDSAMMVGAPFSPVGTMPVHRAVPDRVPVWATSSEPMTSEYGPGTQGAMLITPPSTHRWVSGGGGGSPAYPAGGMAVAAPAGVFQYASAHR